MNYFRTALLLAGLTALFMGVGYLIGGGTGFAGVAFLLTSLHHWYVNPERNASFILIPIGFTSILIGLALLVATTAVYFFGRNRMRTASEGFPSAPGQG